MNSLDPLLSSFFSFDLSDFHALQEQTDALEAAKREKERDTQRSAREISADASADPLTALQVDQSGVMEEEEGETDVSSEGDGRRTGTLRRSRKGLSPLKAFAEDVFRRSRRWHGNERGKSTIRHRTKKAERKGRREIAGELAGVGEGDATEMREVCDWTRWKVDSLSSTAVQSGHSGHLEFTLESIDRI
uniref:Uncharacterized protein n=1 Tax=Chromera velia CCMP2878 TaxID=1169474 RepID=A0A0G4F4L5_9ALVE|eukprot:Cvel_15008.t1-p1 / transcript=Cvel_15008.t1 / gene=Cvel_15008 / organism=Chromera_velia_CCMP2878 / gene_product=hypothetical protein / transcript_product=hypothetical protein / location=Cvel_scaffold1092:20952-22799(+) / protein_length=189 / sequence_SO=supercontig / SO=protein_coding / is_pseudo=false